jgi:hypothetical protein
MKFFKNIAIALVIVAINSINAAEVTRKSQKSSGKVRKEYGRRRPAKRSGISVKDEQDREIESSMELSCSNYPVLEDILENSRYNKHELCRVIDTMVRRNEMVQQATKTTKKFPNELDRLGSMFSKAIISFFSREIKLSQDKKEAIQMCVNKSIATIKDQIKKGTLRLPEVDY